MSGKMNLRFEKRNIMGYRIFVVINNIKINFYYQATFYTLLINYASLLFLEVFMEYN